MHEGLSPAGSLKYSTLLFVLSYRCNIRCNVCSVGPLLTSNAELEVAQARRLIHEAAALGTVKNIGFTGGEPFLRYKQILELLAVTHDQYGWAANITTNCTWAKTPEQARRLLVPLRERGLDALLVSLDDSHLEFVDLECHRNVLVEAVALGIRCQVQTVITRRSRTAADFRELFPEVSGHNLVTWLDSRCVPMGFAATKIAKADLIASKGVKMGGCTLYQFISVMPNGDVGLCCSFFPPSLAVGNVFQDSLGEILARAERAPLVNAVFLWGGPRLVAETLRDKGLAEYAEREYTSVCHACEEILSDPRAVAVASAALGEVADELHAAAVEAETQHAYLERRATQIETVRRLQAEQAGRG